jgi:hypothetical protein
MSGRNRPVSGGVPEWRSQASAAAGRSAGRRDCASGTCSCACARVRPPRRTPARSRATQRAAVDDRCRRQAVPEPRDTHPSSGASIRQAARTRWEPRGGGRRRARTDGLAHESSVSSSTSCGMSTTHRSGFIARPFASRADGPVAWPLVRPVVWSRPALRAPPVRDSRDTTVTPSPRSRECGSTDARDPAESLTGDRSRLRAVGIAGCR